MRELSNAIEIAFSERTNLLIVALTGRTGSGCTTTAKAMSSNFAELSISKTGLSEIEQRKLDICTDFSKNQWVPFKQLSVSTVILSYLLQESNSDVASLLSQHIKADKTRDSLITQLDELRAEPTFKAFHALTTAHDLSSAVDAWIFYSGPLTTTAALVKKVLDSSYAAVFQTLGDNIRKSGRALSGDIDPNQVFALITRVKRIAKAAGKWDRVEGREGTRVVIDAVRNPLELVYLRDQFAAFYAIAITAHEQDRRARLSDAGLRSKEIDALDKREYSKKSLSSYDAFVSQNLQECIQKSDIFIHNNGAASEFEQNKLHLNRQIIRYVSLMARPGIVTPTSDERSMQLAFVAKLNSGCISRQVGAAITDASASIKAVGWNDVPKGQVPCLLRDVSALLHSDGREAFSHYEKNDRPFREHLAKEFAGATWLKTTEGLPCPFCFKDAYNTVTKEKNQVHTRALHAEENAFLQLAKYGNSGIAGGQLFTTASPCELCSKKAYQLGIREIIYVDPYPGISSSHILAAGPVDARPKLRLFGGAIGNAYHRLYDPVLPIKDEYNARLKDGPPPPPPEPALF